MSAELTSLIFSSKLLDTREKWVLVRLIKNNQLSPDEVRRIESLINKEDEMIHQTEKKNHEVYLEALKKWHTQLTELYHQHVVQKRAKVSESEHQKEAEAADQLLNDL